MSRKSNLVIALIAILLVVMGIVSVYLIKDKDKKEPFIDNNDQSIQEPGVDENNQLNNAKELKNMLSEYEKETDGVKKQAKKEQLMKSFKELYFKYFPTSAMNGTPTILSYDNSKLNNLNMSYIVWDYIYDSRYTRYDLIIEEETLIKLKASYVHDYLLEIFNIKNYDVKDIDSTDKSGRTLKKENDYYVINGDVYFGMGNYDFEYNLRDIVFDSKFNQVMITFDITYHDAIGDVLRNKKTATFNYDEKLSKFYLTKVE